jgi:hypothetical protein
MIKNHSWVSELARAKAFELLADWHENGQDDPCTCTGDIVTIEGVCESCGYKVDDDEEEA